MTASSLPYLDASAIEATLPWGDAVDCLEQALLRGFDPACSAARSVIDVAHGQLLLMPAELADHVGVKIGTVAPGNPAMGLPRIQALYAVIDSATLTPVALMDGTALTTLRTPAMSAVAARHIAPVDARHLVVFGAGPQAWGHVHAMRAVRPIERVTVIGRRPDTAAALVRRLYDVGISAEVGTVDSLPDGDIVVCATTAGVPLFDSSLMKDNVCAIAVGSHDSDRRELDSNVFRRARTGVGVVVETRHVALQEAGDVAMAVAEHAIQAEDLIEIATLVRRPPSDPSGTGIYKSVGMGWQDLVVAQAIMRRSRV